MKPHNIIVDRYKASPDNLELGTYGSYGNEILKFCFKDGWDDTTSVIAVFNSNLDNPTSVLVESDGICKVPHEATDSVTNDGRITLVGYKDNAKIISLDLSFVVCNHSAVDGEPPQEPTPDIFQQILDVSKDAVDTANEAKEIASKSYEETKQYAEQAKQSADSAAQNAEIAKENADKVVSVKDEVDSAKQQALTEIDDSKTNAVQAIGTVEANALGAISKSQSSAISSIQASEKNALDNISDLKSSALSDIDDAKTSSVNAVNSASQTAQSDITNLKTQSLEEIDAKKAESLQEISTAKTDAVDTVRGVQSDAETAISKAKTGALENIATEKETSVKAVNDAGSTATGAIADAKSDALSEIGTAKTGAVEAVTAEGDKQAERVQAIFPAVTEDDDGKVPIVQNGAWTLGEVAQDAYTRAESDVRYAPIESAIRPTANGNPAVCEDSIAWAFQGLKVYGKSTQVVSTGAQLLPTEQIKETTANGITFSPVGNGAYHVYGTATADATGFFYGNNFELLPGTYTMSVNPEIDTSKIKVCLSDLKGISYVDIGRNTNKSTQEIKSAVQVALLLRVYTGQTVDHTVYPMLVEGSTVKPWEPYTGGKPSPSPEYPQPIVSAGDGGSIDLTVSNGASLSQSMTIATPTGLPGIPVDSGGNYTDAEGQQSACDVKDYGTGKYTQMVGHIESYNSENITTPYMSTTGQLSTGAEVYYILDEPVVTDISADELTAYRVLTTYSGTTVVSTAEPVAGIEARYVADPQKYIDKQVEAAVSKAITAAVKLSGGNA